MPDISMPDISTAIAWTDRQNNQPININLFMNTHLFRDDQYTLSKTVTVQLKTPGPDEGPCTARRKLRSKPGSR